MTSKRLVDLNEHIKHEPDQFIIWIWNTKENINKKTKHVAGKMY